MIPDAPLRMVKVGETHTMPTRKRDIRMLVWDTSEDGWVPAPRMRGTNERWYEHLQQTARAASQTQGVGGCLWYDPMLRGLHIGKDITKPFLATGFSVYQNGTPEYGTDHIGKDGKVVKEPSPEFQLFQYTATARIAQDWHAETGAPVFIRTDGTWQIARFFEYEEERIRKELPRRRKELAYAKSRVDEWGESGLTGIEARIVELEQRWETVILPNRARLNAVLGNLDIAGDTMHCPACGSSSEKGHFDDIDYDYFQKTGMCFGCYTESYAFSEHYCKDIRHGAI